MNRADTFFAAEANTTRQQLDSESIDVETLFKIRRPDFIRFLVRYGVDVVEAEDVTQEVFLRLFDKKEVRVSRENLFEWLLTCAKNLAVNRFHRNRREVKVVSEIWEKWAASLQDNTSNPEQYTEEQQQQWRLAHAISSLSPLEQQCILLRGQGVTFRQMAELLDTPSRQIIYITDVAVTKLQKKLKSFR